MISWVYMTAIGKTRSVKTSFHEVEDVLDVVEVSDGVDIVVEVDSAVVTDIDRYCDYVIIWRNQLWSLR